MNKEGTSPKGLKHDEIVPNESELADQSDSGF